MNANVRGAGHSRGSFGGSQMGRMGDKVSNQVHMKVCYEHDSGDCQVQEKVDNLVVVDELEGVALPSDREIELQ
ncbi:hypothetical protein V6N13_029245 [Hibiscus sabdariffa]